MALKFIFIDNLIYWNATKDRYETYLTRKNILEDLIEQTFKILKSSTDSNEVKEEAKKIVDYRLQLIDVNEYLEKSK